MGQHVEDEVANEPERMSPPEAGSSAPALGEAPQPDSDREPTGDPAVDEALEEFDRLTGAPLDTHIEVAERVHRTLQSRLTDLGNA